MFWTPAFAGVTLQETFYEIIKFGFCNWLGPTFPGIDILVLGFVLGGR
jgi:hypothetical protein